VRWYRVVPNVVKEIVKVQGLSNGGLRLEYQGGGRCGYREFDKLQYEEVKKKHL